MSLVGFDDIPFANLYNTKLTTVKQDINALCENAFGIMMERINRDAENRENKKVIVPTQLKIGETCRKLMGSYPTSIRGPRVRQNI
jgi:LacI family transcriptional regulator/LacI family repressor for deo operon, udp, cdd, tsx, nupC, and nupG